MSIEARETRKADGHPAVAVMVSDSHADTPAEIRGRIFDLFIATRARREHGCGATFEVCLPAAEDAR